MDMCEQVPELRGTSLLRICDPAESAGIFGSRRDCAARDADDDQEAPMPPSLWAYLVDG